MEEVILVNEKDEQTGTMEKLEAHRRGLLHRAFSVFIFNSKGELLLQKRAEGKYHSAGLWTNTCCSHPRPGESVEEAAKRRLKEEMGMECELKKEFFFIYNIEFKNGLKEHELDYILTGYCDDPPLLNPEEASEWKYISPKDLISEIKKYPENYTEWFKMIAEKVIHSDENLQN